MDKEFAWKNFSLGVELDVAGSFIYNGLKSFHGMSDLTDEGQVFEVLYNLAVGIERLSKITVILLEHTSVTNQEKFEEDLVTHNHHELIGRISKHRKLNFAKIHNDFIILLRDFYKSMRYGRYSLSDWASFAVEREALIDYISNDLDINLNPDSLFGGIANNNRIRKSIGKVVGKICEQLYQIIEDTASRQGMYTYEIRTESKASKIFLRREYNFIDEELALMELLVYLVNTEDETQFFNFLREITPIEFDSEMMPQYIASFTSDIARQELLDMVESFYQDIEDKDEIKDRLGMIGAINNPHCVWMADDEEEPDEEEW